VIHLRTPHPDQGYNHKNPLRVETPEQARAVDERILAIWSGHPNRIVIDATDDFLTKAHAALDALRAQIPECCRRGRQWLTIGSEKPTAGRSK